MAASIFLTCLGIGVFVELIALQLNLWVYRRPWWRLASIALVFGLGFGSLSVWVAERPAALRFADGAVVGIGYEAANLYRLQLFAFEEPLSLIRSRVLLLLVVGVPWGVIPALAPAIAYFVHG